jgi:hypothetical protein
MSRKEEDEDSYDEEDEVPLSKLVSTNTDEEGVNDATKGEQAAMSRENEAGKAEESTDDPEESSKPKAGDDDKEEKEGPTTEDDVSSNKKPKDPHSKEDGAAAADPIIVDGDDKEDDSNETTAQDAAASSSADKGETSKEDPSAATEQHGITDEPKASDKPAEDDVDAKEEDTTMGETSEKEPGEAPKKDSAAEAPTDELKPGDNANEDRADDGNTKTDEKTEDAAPPTPETTPAEPAKVDNDQPGTGTSSAPEDMAVDSEDETATAGIMATDDPDSSPPVTSETGDKASGEPSSTEQQTPSVPTAADYDSGEASATQPATSAAAFPDNSLRRQRPKSDFEAKPTDEDEPPTSSWTESAEKPHESIVDETGEDPDVKDDSNPSPLVQGEEAEDDNMQVDNNSEPTINILQTADTPMDIDGNAVVLGSPDNNKKPTPTETPVPAGPPREIPTWIVESESEDDEEGADPFEAFKTATTKKTSSKPKKKRRGRKPRLAVNITSFQSSTTETEDEKKDEQGDYTAANPITQFKSDILNLSVEEQMARAEAELEDSLSFFRDSHEEQDPAFAHFVATQKKKLVEVELKKLDFEDATGRKDIEMIVAEQLKIKKAATERSVEKYKVKKMTEEKKDLLRLQKIFSEKAASNQSKINQGIQVLKKRHSQETQRVLQQHRQQVQQRQIPEQMASNEWANLQQRLNSKHERQIQEFAGKGEEVKGRTEADYRREQVKIRQQYEKQISDVENNCRNIYSKMYTGFQQLRQRYLKRHIQKIMKKKEALQKALQEHGAQEQKKEEKEKQSKNAPKAASDDKAALRPPSPIKTSGEGFNFFPYEKSGAASRHKHRKAMLSQIAKQLSVEIHNEGVWMALLKEKKDEKRKEAQKDPHTDSDKKSFLPWGIQARDFLELIICGEIPTMLETEDFDFGDTVALNGGHIRCVLTDLRTSDETARVQRIESIRDQAHTEIELLEKKTMDLQNAFSNAEKMHARCDKEEKDILPPAKDAITDYEGKKISWQNFRTKFAKYLGPGKYLRGALSRYFQSTEIQRCLIKKFS